MTAAIVFESFFVALPLSNQQFFYILVEPEVISLSQGRKFRIQVSNFGLTLQHVPKRIKVTYAFAPPPLFINLRHELGYQTLEIDTALDY